MWREKIIEAKKAKNLSTKTMSEKSPSHMPEETITRILNGKTEFPRIDSVLDLCAQVGLSPWELFEETTSRISDESIVTLQQEVDMLKFERDALLRENGVLKDKVETLRDRVETLKDEIITIHSYYNKIKK